MKKFLTANPFSLIIAGILVIQTIIGVNSGRLIKSTTHQLENKITDLDSKITKLAPSSNDTVITALATLREELVKYRAEQTGRDQILGLMTNNASQEDGADPYADLSTTLDRALAVLTTPTPTPTGQLVKLKANWSTADAFEQPRASSKIIGQLIKNQSYLVKEKQTDWYLVQVNSSQTGWVSAQLLNETTY